MTVTYVLVARIPRAGAEVFQRYEASVLPLLAEHGGRLARRLRTADGEVEVHLVEFPSAGAFDSYHADPRRAEHAGLLETSGARTELLAVEDVPTA